MFDERQSFLDSVSVLSFIYGYLNYNETVNKSQMSDMINEAIFHIQRHLEIQDTKLTNIENSLNKILENINTVGGSGSDK